MCFKKLLKKYQDQYIKCPLCEGKGYIGTLEYEKCPRCEGFKKVPKPEKGVITCGTCGCRLED